MDWITENLLRQRKAWHALLTAFAGKRNKKAAPERAGKDSAGSAPTASADGTETLRHVVRAAQAPRRAAPAGKPPKSAAGRETRLGRALPTRASRPDGRPAEPAGETLRAELARRSELRRRSISGAGTAKSAVPAVEFGTETAESFPSVFRKPLLRARELSRTGERDARRYDGGFAPF